MKFDPINRLIFLNCFYITSEKIDGFVAAPNIVLGYIQEQVLTTLNTSPVKLFGRKFGRVVRGDIYPDKREQDYTTLVGLGGLVGLIQDISMIGLTISHLSGVQNEWTQTASIGTITKICTNVASLAYKTCKRE